MKPASAKAKGRDSEIIAADFAKWITGWPVERRAKHGSRDEGDLAGFPLWLAVEVKSSMGDINIGMDQAYEECENAGADYPVLICRRRRSDPAHWYAGMPYLAMLHLLVELDTLRKEVERLEGRG